MDSSPPNTNKALTKTRFSDLEPPLSEDIIDVLNRSGFRLCTPVQAKTIPLLCRHKDVAVDASTGSGKTLAFILPVVEIIRRSISYPPKPHQVIGVIISPTRELSKQIYDVAKPFVSTLPNVKSVLLLGGRDVKADMRTIEEEGCNLLIGTPGRLSDIMKQVDFLNFRNLEILILDEADRLLEDGFDKQVNYILSCLPKQRRTGLFSATQTDSIEDLAKAGLRNPVRVNIRTQSKSESSSPKLKNSKIPSGLRLEYLECKADSKSSQLVDLLVANKNKKLIVFFMTCASVDYWGLVLSKIPKLKSISLIPIHGGMKQTAREKALASFTKAASGALLCTDVTARGIDIPGIDYVVQFDPPQKPDDFNHRVGRAARMGEEGRATVFLLPKEKAYVNYLRIKGIFCRKVKCSEKASDVIPIIRSLAMNDRAVLEKGLRAFVSFVRGYKGHILNYIFRWQELEIGKIAMGWGLLYLPSMSEIKQHRLSSDGFTPVEDVKFEDIKFKDKAREKERQKNIQARKEKREEEKRERDKKHLKKAVGACGSTRKRKLPQKKRNINQTAEDDEEMDRSYVLWKQLKRGTITDDEFAKLTEADDF